MELTWRKSTRSTANGQCVEVAALPDGGWKIRDSKNPDVELTFTAGEVAAFKDGIGKGEFDA